MNGVIDFASWRSEIIFKNDQGFKIQAIKHVRITS
jgi:hypothetical protein